MSIRIAAQEVDVPVELVGATGVAGRATAPVRRALANREVETLDERGVQGLGILRLPQRSLQPTPSYPNIGPPRIWNRCMSGSSRLLKNSAKWDRQIDPVVLRCSQH